MNIIPENPNLHQREFSFARPAPSGYWAANLEDAATAGLIRVWSTAVANDWPHLAELARGQLEKAIRGDDER